MYVNTQQKWHHLYCVFTYMYSLLIEKDLCECQNVSIKLLCALSCEDIFIFSVSVSPFYTYICVIYIYTYTHTPEKLTKSSPNYIQTEVYCCHSEHLILLFKSKYVKSNKICGEHGVQPKRDLGIL